MKNQILTAKQEDKYAVSLWRYEKTPSDSIRPILMVSSEFVFTSEDEARQHLISVLKPEVLANTEIKNAK